MRVSIDTYIPGPSLVHDSDARVKFILLLVLSVAAFCVTTWTGLALLAGVVVACIVAAHLPWRRLALLSVPLLVVLALVWVCNAFMFDVSHPASSGLIGASAGFVAGWKPVALIGSFGFSPEGCMYGLFYAVRILLILFASFVVTFTTTATQLTGAFTSLLAPLRVVKVPVDDIAMMLSIALRFIPITADEVTRVRNAQLLRGASFGSGSIWQRVTAWQTVFVPVIVGLFRRADALAEAMEARCYGAGKRSSLHETRFAPSQALVLACGVAFCVAVAWVC